MGLGVHIAYYHVPEGGSAGVPCDECGMVPAMGAAMVATWVMVSPGKRVIKGWCLVCQQLPEIAEHIAAAKAAEVEMVLE